MTTFSHIINPVTREENAELFAAQQITFKSILKARSYSAEQNVKLYSVSFFGSDLESVPNDFTQLPKLNRRISNIAQTKKNNPILSDILQSALANCDSEYIVFTNLDIGLMPYFYEAISYYISLGHDAIIINRRRIKSRFNTVNNLEAIYAEAGKTHTGYDCFVIKKTVLQKFIFKNIAIGVPPAGNDVFYNIFAFAEKPVLFTEKHLTFHIGMELYKEWGDKEIYRHNYKEFYQLLKELKPNLKADHFPASDLGFFKRHFKWLMNPTLSYSELCTADLKQLGRKRSKKVYDPNYKKQSYYEWLMKYINFD